MKTIIVTMKNEVDEIFNNAILEGILSDNEEDDNYAGNFMYMYSKGGKHYFKNMDTREYGFDKTSIKNSCIKRF